MKRYIILFLAVVLFVSCKNGVNYVFPTEYKFSKEKTFTSHLTKITIYDIRGTVDPDSLKNYPMDFDDKYYVQKWVDFNDLTDVEQDWVEYVVKQREINLELVNTPSEELKTVIANFPSFYFSGYILKRGPKIRDGESRNYDDFYLLNLNNKKLYRFKHMPGY